MSNDKKPTLYVIAHGGRWVMASCASTTRSFVEADLHRLLSKEPAFPGNPEVVPYVPASEVEALRDLLREAAGMMHHAPASPDGASGCSAFYMRRFKGSDADTCTCGAVDALAKIDAALGGE